MSGNKTCYFCGDNKVRTTKRLNKVQYVLTSHILRKKVYCCEDCFKYLQHLGGRWTVRRILERD